MGLPNLKLRGGSYHWRRKITVAGTPLPLSISLRTGHFATARLISDRLAVAVERLRVAYGQFTGMTPDQMKKVFSDALRWQLQRILQDQAANPAAKGDHATANSLHAEAWTFLGQHGGDARWTIDEHERLIASGWPPAHAKAIGDHVFDTQAGGIVSERQIASYVEAFGIPATGENVTRMTAIICRARAHACRQATALLDSGDDAVLSGWANEALLDDTPFAFDTSDVAFRPTERPATHEPQPDERTAVPPSPSVVVVARTKKLLMEATEDCIADYAREQAWDSNSIQQVRTAVRMFDFASGVGVYIEDLQQKHVRDFTTLCKSLPNRWGRTTAEAKGGIAASLERAKTMEADDIGLGQLTINKHISWIEAVLTHAAGDEADDTGHRPAAPLSFKAAKTALGKKVKHQRKRDRDKRANWTRQEVATLLSAPIWTGTAGIDKRLKPGTEIIHDSWYWMPLMLPLYGGRSSELAGLALAEVHEHDPIPHFRLEFTELRRLKNAQSIRRLPIHPELIRLGFIDYVTQLRAAGCTMLFPELHSPESKSFAGTFYRTVFKKLRDWAFPEGTAWRHRVGGAWKDKDVHSYRGLATSMMKGKVEDSVRGDIFGHEGDTETARTYDEEAELHIKLEALKLLTPITQQIQPSLPIRIRPLDRLRHGTASRR
ncbi:hypothetical protein [Sphingomonas sp.]|uniref:hypothetical protein n=1 Tax=Sphingomonas sp. TaxID=28214 RepID=UPI0035C7F5C8